MMTQSPVRIEKPLLASEAVGAHPNEIDLRRIAKMLTRRSRYRYVAASILPANFGYRVISPCCSRSISAVDGPIDIALIQFDDATRTWMLFNKDHRFNQWQLHATAPRLDGVMACLNDDPGRLFWL